MRIFIRRWLWLLAFYFFFRLLFLWHNHQDYATASASELWGAFLLGLRFDLWAVGWSLLPLFILALAPRAWQRRPQVELAALIYAGAVNFWCFGLNVIDVELFQFTGRRISMDWLKLGQDMQQQSWSLVSYYWWLALLGLALWWWFIRYFPRWSPTWPVPPSPWRRLFGVLFVVVYLFSLRGGWQLKPLSLNHAYGFRSSQLGVLALNSTFSFFRNRKVVESLSLSFFPSMAAAELVFKQAEPSPAKEFGVLKGRNVVLIIMESLSSEYVGKMSGRGMTPEFDRLSENGLLFTNNFANGRRSIEAVPSLLCGVPSLMSEALIVSPYAGVDLSCLGHWAQDQGYQTLFFHGAHNGSMHFDSFSARAGFREYYGFDEFGDASQSDGQWGIFDAPMFEFMKQRLNQKAAAGERFMAVFFSLSAHHPYHVPSSMKGRFAHGELEIEESMRYADWALAQFFSQAEQEPWFKNTVFLVTGDHTHKSRDPRFQDLLGVYRVPLWIWAPGADLDADTERLTQHIDVPVTIAELLGWQPAQRSPFGRSVFAAGSGEAFNAYGVGYWLARDQHVVFIDPTHQTLKNWVRRGFELQEQTTQDGPVAERLKAIVHVFNQAVLGNRLNRPLQNNPASP